MYSERKNLTTVLQKEKETSCSQKNQPRYSQITHAPQGEKRRELDMRNFLYTFDKIEGSGS